MIHLGCATALWLLPLVIAALFALLRYWLRIQKNIVTLSTPLLRNQMIKNFSLLQILVRMSLMVLALGALFVGMLRLQYPLAESVKQRGRDLVIALDISRSMLAQDCVPSRLACAKKKIATLLEALGAERCALLIFAGQAIVQCPLTYDQEAFNLFLDAIDAQSIAGGGTTALDAALEKSIELFGDQQRNNRIVLLFTDGEDFSKNLATVEKKAQELSVRLCAVGVGTPAGAPIPIYTPEGALQGHLRNAQGDVVMSRLEETTLKKLTHDLRGLYVRLDAKHDSDVDRIVSWVKQFEKEESSAVAMRPSGELFMFFSALAFLALLIGFLL